MSAPGSSGFKLCPSCGSSMVASAPWCAKCGHRFDAGTSPQPPPQAPPQAGPYAQQNPYQQPTYQQPPYQQNPYQQNPYQHPPGGYPRNYGSPTSNKDGFAIAGFVLSLLGMLAFCIWCVSVPLCILGVSFSVAGRESNQGGLANAGIVCSIIGLILNVGFFIWVGSGGFGAIR